MKETEIRKLVDLAAQSSADASQDIKKVFDWYNERKIMVVKGTIGVAISLIIALLIAYYKNELKVDLQVWITFGAGVVLALFGLNELRNLKKIGSDYMSAKSILDKLSTIKPFIILYRKSKTSQDV